LDTRVNPMTKYKPPQALTLKDLLLQMSGCRVSTNTNGGNPMGNDKHKKNYLKGSYNKQKAHKRGANIDLGHRFTEEKRENKRY